VKQGSRCRPLLQRVARGAPYAALADKLAAPFALRASYSVKIARVEFFWAVENPEENNPKIFNSLIQLSFKFDSRLLVCRKIHRVFFNYPAITFLAVRCPAIIFPLCGLFHAEPIAAHPPRYRSSLAGAPSYRSRVT
jgi:hypothetical protein